MLCCQPDVCWVTDWLTRWLDDWTAGCTGRSNQREREDERGKEGEGEGEREMPEMFMIAVMQFDMWNTKCINPAYCSPVTMHLSALLTQAVCVSACVKSAFVQVCAALCLSAWVCTQRTFAHACVCMRVNGV